MNFQIDWNTRKGEKNPAKPVFFFFFWQLFTSISDKKMDQLNLGIKRWI